jgi:hypothetical protein
MENQLDKLFREKLENHSIPTTPLTWDRVSENAGSNFQIISGRKRIVWAWRIAAVLFIVGFIGWFLKVSPGQQTKQMTQIRPKENVIDKTKTVVVELPMETKAQTVAATVHSTTIKEFIDQSKSVGLVEEEHNKKAESLSVPQEVQLIASVEEAIEPEVEIVPTMTSMKEKPMVIVYSLPSVERIHVVAEEKTKGFQKVIQFAKDVKGGDATFASVRSLKENIFGSDEISRFEKRNNN